MIEINLKGKTALVCGSTAGIGWAISKAFATAGAKVILCGRSKEKLVKCIKELKELNSLEHSFVIADYNNLDEVKNAAIEASKHQPDILVNNTGGPPAGLAHEADIDAYLLAFQQHLINNQVMTSAMIPHMKAKQFGRVINIISTSVKAPLANLGVSNTVRGAVGNWSKTIANELGKFGITVNNILPGATATGRLSSIIQNKAKKLNKTEEEVSQGMLSAIPANRFGEPKEPANAAAFLASDLASYINGTNVVVDGGRTPML